MQGPPVTTLWPIWYKYGNIPNYYSKVANKRAGANKSAWWIFLRKLINVQGEINMQGGNILIPENHAG